LIQVYFGDIGEDAIIIRNYFARYGAICPDDANPAEYMLEAIGAGLSPCIGDCDWAEIWANSPECKQAKEEIQYIKIEGLSCPIDVTKASRYATPFLYQLRVVSKRTFIALWRSPDYVHTRLFMHVALSFVISLAFLRLGNGARDLQSRVFAV
jgi:ATP-binding cassette, subfamily G (WHITE), member 2, SNQ2